MVVVALFHDDLKKKKNTVVAQLQANKKDFFDCYEVAELVSC